MTGNLLLVGDLRPGMNFGAIATSDCLLRLAEEEVGHTHLRSIDSRSFKGRTPRGGYAPFKIPRRQFKMGDSSAPSKVRIKRLAQRVLFALGYRKLQDAILKIPNSWAEYEEGGECFRKGRWLPFERELLEWADAVVINAEGSIVHNIHNVGGKYRPGARYMTFLGYLSKFVYNKPTAIVNHIVDPDSDDFREVIRNLYPHMNHVLVRDEVSASNLKTLGFDRAEIVPDALFSSFIDESLIGGYEGWKYFDSGKPIAIVGDSASIPYVNWSRLDFYSQLFRDLSAAGYQPVFLDGESLVSSEFEQLCRRAAIPRITVYNTSWMELGAVFAKSAVFFSGRWHASILATMAGCPCVLFGSDSHKTRALHAMVDCRTSFLDISRLPNTVEQIIEAMDFEVKLGADRREGLKRIANGYRDKTSRYREIIRELIPTCSSDQLSRI